MAVFKQVLNALYGVLSYREVLGVFFSYFLIFLFDLLGLGALIALFANMFETPQTTNIVINYLFSLNLSAQIALVLLLFFCKSILVLKANQKIYYFSEGLQESLRRQVFAQILNQISLADRPMVKADVLTHMFTVIPNLIQKIILNSLRVGVDLMVFVFILLIVTLYLSPIILIPLIMMTVCLGILGILVRRLTNSLGVQINNGMREQISITDQALGGIMEIRIQKLVSIFEKRFKTNAAVYSKSASIYQMFGGVTKYAVELVAVFVLCVCVYLFHSLKLQDFFYQTDISVMLASFIVVVARGVPLLSSMAVWRINYSVGLDSFYRFVEFKQNLNKRSVGHNKNFGAVAEEQITLKNISLLRGDTFVFEKYSEQISLGESVYITGPSGTGKTSLLALIGGGISPSSGEVSLPNSIVSKYEDGDYFCYVSQAPVFFEGTLYENLSMLCKTPPRTDLIYQMLREVKLDIWFEQLPDGMETLFQLEDTMASVGQRQRLAIVRAILAQRPIMLFDEVTSALDDENKVICLDFISRHLKSDVTVFFVSHDEITSSVCTSTISTADFIN